MAHESPLGEPNAIETDLASVPNTEPRPSCIWADASTIREVTTSRRHFLRVIAAPAAMALPRLSSGARLGAQGPPDTGRGGPGDEDFWAEVRRAFDLEPGVINLDNGAASPAPQAVQRAMFRRWRRANRVPSHHLSASLAPDREPVREALAALIGAEAEEVALTRNASESLETCQLGLPLGPGDEVLTSDQDYPRMLATFDQRARREGIVVRRVALPVPSPDDDEVVHRFVSAIGPKTRLILVCHMINLTGQVLPVREIVTAARARGVPVIVDGAHALGHLAFSMADLGCDYYAASLHKWLSAPLGTGMLFVRRAKIASLWPLMAAPERLDADIRKFEEVGTRPIADQLAVGEAIAFHEWIGSKRKLARLRALRDRWARRVEVLPRVRMLTDLTPHRGGGMATVGIEGIDPGRLARWLWSRHRVLVAVVRHPDVEGIRVSPGIYTMLDEVDRLAALIERVATKGWPG